MPLLSSCQNQDNKGSLTIRDIEIFKNTPVWDLVLAVDDDNVSKVKNILKNNPNIVNHQEPFYGTTCLMWAMSNRKYKAAQALLENGANPDVIANTGTTALFRAIDFKWGDSRGNEDAKYVKLLLKYKANPNLNYCSPKIEGKTSSVECGTSPLIHAVSKGFEKIEALVKAGANINYATKTGITASMYALLHQDVKTAYYLIVEKKTDITKPYYYYKSNTDTINLEDARYPVDLLLEWTFELDSYEYNLKKKIIKEFSKQGINYQERKSKIHPITLDKIKKLHPNNWEEYLKKY